jgi:hypothetical protein
MNTLPQQEKDQKNGWRLVIGSVSLLLLIFLAALIYLFNRGRMNTEDWTLLFLISGSASGVLFYLIDPQSQQSFAFRKIVNLSGAAAIGAGFMFLAHWFAVHPPEAPFILPDAQVVLLDSPYKINVYDPDRRKHGGANSDEIKGILATLPDIAIRAIRCTEGWSDHQSLLESSPDLVIMHYSTFRAEEGTNNYVALLEQFLESMAAIDKTKFLVYSRQFLDHNDTVDLGPLLGAIPSLKGRLETFCVKHGTFMEPETANELRNVVSRLLHS